MAKGSDKPKEVRRFGMEQNEVTSFELLKSKIRQVFPSLAATEFSISWKDFEDDEVVISSNEELLTALTESSDRVRRLYITAKSPVCLQTSFQWKPNAIVVEQVKPVEVHDSNEDDDDEEEEEVPFTPPGSKRSWYSSLRAANTKFHPNVYCDGCERHVYGHRYKCLECDDFDLCHDCETQMLHKDHIMLRIPLAMNHYTKLNNFTKSMRYMMDTLHKIDRRVKKQARRMHKIYDDNSQECCSGGVATDEACDHGSKRCKRDEKEKAKEQLKREYKEFKSSCHADLGRKHNIKVRFGGCPMKEGKTTCSDAPTSAAAPGTADQGTGADGSGSAAGKRCPFPGGILNSFLNPQTLGNFLNPENLNTLQQIFEHMSPVPEHLLQEVAQNLADVKLSDQAAPKEAPTSQTENPFAKKTAATDGAGPSTSSQADKSQPQPSAEQEVSAQPDVNVAGGSLPQSGRSSRSSSEEADAEGWTVVDEQSPSQLFASTEAAAAAASAASAAAAAAASAAAAAAMYPKLPRVEPTPVAAVEAPQVFYHPDPDVNRCLIALAEMGYGTDQQMINLAVEYKGNVSRVLNVLLS